jgi:hypothetical protein
MGQASFKGVAATLCEPDQAARGVKLMARAVRVNVLPDAQACDAVSAAEYWKFPAVVLSQTEMCDRVSDVPPFVHAAGADVRDMDPPDAALNVNAFRVVSPAAAAVVPADPGSPVWSLAA